MNIYFVFRYKRHTAAGFVTKFHKVTQLILIFVVHEVTMIQFKRYSLTDLECCLNCAQNWK